jgi:hypothetical protein
MGPENLDRACLFVHAAIREIGDSFNQWNYDQTSDAREALNSAVQLDRLINMRETELVALVTSDELNAFAARRGTLNQFNLQFPAMTPGSATKKEPPPKLSESLLGATPSASDAFRAASGR